MKDPTAELAAGLVDLGMDPKEAADYAEEHRGPQADRELEAVALGFDSAQDRADYERKMLGDRHCDLVERLRTYQYRGFDETNANLNEAAHVIAELLDTVWMYRRQLARVRAIAKDHCGGSTLDRLRSGLLDILDAIRP